MPTKDTNSSGEATFELSAGNYSVNVSEPGYVDGSDSFSIGDNEQITRVVTLSEEEPATVTVTVTDADTGTAIEGATVTASGTSQTTDSSGVTTLSLPAGSHEITANSGGYVSNSTPITVDWGESVSTSLPLTAEVEPTLVDDFERTNIDPWTDTSRGDTPISITSGAGINSSRGLHCPTRGEGEVFAGLDNFPEADGGPNNDGAWDFWIRPSVSEGTADIARFEFAKNGTREGRLRFWFDITNNSVSLRHMVGTTSDFLMGHTVTMSTGSAVNVIVNEWRSDGYFSVEYRNESGTLLDEEAATLDIGSSIPIDGGMSIWCNDTTGVDIDEIHLRG